MTSAAGRVSPVAAMRASARSLVPDVTMPVGTPPSASAASRSAAPGSSTMPSTSATSISRMRANASARRSSGSRWAMTFDAVTPWKPVSRTGSTSYSSHHRTHERTTAGIESMRVPSRSSSTPPNDAAKGSATDVSGAAADDGRGAGGMGASLGAAWRHRPRQPSTSSSRRRRAFVAA